MHTIVDISNAVARNARIAVILRHAERPPLQMGDMTFGKTLPLTSKGKSDAEKLGRTFARLCAGKRFVFYHGESLRCRMTAEAISDSVYLENTKICELSFLGGNSPFLADVNERMKLVSSGNYLSKLNEYFSLGRQKGFHPLYDGFRKFDDLVVKNSSADVSVFVTHDLNLACYMAGSGICPSFNSSTWPHFLDFAIREIPAG